jgi:hypothetical protein
MAEELGTRDVLEQVHTRLGTLEQDVRSLDSKVEARFDRVYHEIGDVRSEVAGFRSEVNARFDRTIRWLVGLIFASWLTLMASIWLKP